MKVADNNLLLVQLVGVKGTWWSAVVQSRAAVSGGSRHHVLGVLPRCSRALVVLDVEPVIRRHRTTAVT